MYHYTYQITNLINNKIYYGVRSSKCTPEMDIKYWGSGIVIKLAIKKYGIEKFIKEIDKTFETRDEANLYEAVIVNEEWVESKDNYNLKTGGQGGRITEEIKRKISKANKGKKRSKEFCKKMSEIMKGCIGDKNGMYGKTHNKKTRQKISQNSKGKQAGKNHYNYRKPLNKKILKQISKNWIAISPDGIEYNINNMAKFCRENNLSNGQMTQVAQGKRTHHKGWKCKKLD